MLFDRSLIIPAEKVPVESEMAIPSPTISGSSETYSVRPSAEPSLIFISFLMIDMPSLLNLGITNSNIPF